MDTTREVRLSSGTLDVTDTGGYGPVLLFVHGLLVGGSLWREVVERVRPWARCVVPELPLGSHRRPMNPDADLSPPAVADLVAELIAAMGLESPTLVGNDTGGAISQLVATRHPERVGRLVLTPCDGFEVFPPKQFKPLLTLPRIPGAVWALTRPTGFARLHNTPLAYGLLVKRPIPTDVTSAWLEPSRTRADIRRDLSKVILGSSPQQTIEAGERLRGFDKPALVVWGADDKVFRQDLGRRLADALPQSRLELVEDSGTFMSLDRPERLAELLEGFVREPVAA